MQIYHFNRPKTNPCKLCRAPATSTLCYRCSCEQLTALKLFTSAKEVRA